MLRRTSVRAGGMALSGRSGRLSIASRLAGLLPIVLRREGGVE